MGRAVNWVFSRPRDWRISSQLIIIEFMPGAEAYPSAPCLRVLLPVSHKMELCLVTSQRNVIDIDCCDLHNILAANEAF